MCICRDEPRVDMNRRVDTHINLLGSMHISDSGYTANRIIATVWGGEPTVIVSERISYCPFCVRKLGKEYVALAISKEDE
jgi:hypothetical protein